ncbi:hypothetical protein CVT26_002215 [Gymnopilus dilepis]|uniref:Uncharacterized protein n=1 Tax=Gymnopilus dilepis TaxID=231916 RepID=A0A409VBI3_9AGAR|nr:hypothetical protein CVT26_002215 [Gymnopilus dilepis]
MLALRPTPPEDLLARRGRSRQVALSALARQASHERRLLPIIAPVPKLAACSPAFMRSASPSPPSSASMSPDYYDSPPSPPRSLEDQVHVAYALDDIHLAKILLLRLKGIEVTSDDDPRIAAVQDEDFDFCFVPNGRLLDENDEKAMQEMQARERERLEEHRRQERLRHCERKWEDEKRRLREERLAVLRRREQKRQEEEERRRRVEAHESRRAAEEERRRAMKAERRASRKVVSFAHLPPAGGSQSLPQPQFVYDFPITPSTSRTPPLVASSSQSTRHTFPSSAFDDAASVPFTDVLKSMQGPLFPATQDERARRSPTRGSRSRTRSQPKRREDRLLDALLVEIEYSQEERRKAKGKQRAQPRRSHPPCLACNAPTPPPLSPVSSSSSSSSSPIPRTSSWLSFRNPSSSSASSSTTDLTTPSSSPIASPKSSWFAASRPRSWLPDPAVTLPTPLRHSCRPHSRLIPVASADSPLVIDPPLPSKSAPISHQGRQRSTSTVHAAKEGAGVLVRRMSKFVELAKGFQNAYVTAALFSVASTYDSLEDRHFTSLDSPDRRKRASQETGSSAVSRSNASARDKLRPAGYRVSPVDVAAFLSTAEQHVGLQTPPDAAQGSLSPRYIPLTSPFPPSETPRTVLPDPLPYRLFFKPIPTPTRSPFRFHALSELHTMYPSADPAPAAAQPGQVSWRIRSVGNPVHLRLKALHNIIWRKGVQWEGVARETALGGGRERVVGVAYEGVGRSSLSRSSSSSSLQE